MCDVLTCTSPQHYCYESTISSLREDQRKEAEEVEVSKRWEARWERMADLKDHRSFHVLVPTVKNMHLHPHSSWLVVYFLVEYTQACVVHSSKS